MSPPPPKMEKGAKRVCERTERERERETAAVGLEYFGAVYGQEGRQREELGTGNR